MWGRWRSPGCRPGIWAWPGAGTRAGAATAARGPTSSHLPPAALPPPPSRRPRPWSARNQDSEILDGPPGWPHPRGCRRRRRRSGSTRGSSGRARRLKPTWCAAASSSDLSLPRATPPPPPPPPPSHHPTPPPARTKTPMAFRVTDKELPLHWHDTDVVSYVLGGPQRSFQYPPQQADRWADRGGVAQARPTFWRRMARGTRRGRGTAW
eukprot:COSAG04_NODE_1484_length_6561_cov_1.862272_5_plen_209_part_00